MDLDALLEQAEQHHRSAAEAEAYARGYRDALRALRDAVLASQRRAQEPAPSEAED